MLRCLYVFLTSFQFAGQSTDSAEPLTPRYSLTANKFENNGYEQQLYLIIFGGITSENKTIAETTILTLGEHDCSHSNTCV